MKYFLLLTMFALVACSENTEDKEKKTFEEKIEIIKKKPITELSKEERNLLILFLESQKEKEE